MKVEYVQSQTSKEGARFWAFGLPASVTISGDYTVREDFGTIVKAIGAVKKNNAIVVEYKKDVVVASAQKGLNVVVQKLEFPARFKTPMPLDRVHLRTWGFWWSDQKRDQVAEPFLDILGDEAPEAVVVRLYKDAAALTAEMEKSQ
jgi:hypothetical protein